MRLARLSALCLLPVAACSLGGEVTPSCPMPLAGWYQPKTGNFDYHDPPPDEIRVVGQQILWHGTPISREKLKAYLGLVQRMNPVPGITVDISEAEDCAEATRVRDLIDARFDCGRYRCWQGTRVEFDKAELRAGEPYAPM